MSAIRAFLLGLAFAYAGFGPASADAGDGRRSAASASAGLDYSAAERRKILAHGPWPPPLSPDPSNRVSGSPGAIAFGEKLFFEPGLSGTGSVLCATCHAPFRGWQDGRPRAFGLEEGARNTPSLLNVRFGRWFGWDGGHDSLWSQSIRPLLDPREMRSSAAQVSAFLRANASMKEAYEQAFRRPLPQDDEELLVDAGKALAAFQETLVTGRTPFDAFRDALARGDCAAADRYPLSARRGLRIFVGKGRCSVCHAGPQFTNGGFADAGTSSLSGDGAEASGRPEGIRRLRHTPYSLAGRFSDDTHGSKAVAHRRIEAQRGNPGEWRVPGLRGVASSAPYMHNGQVAALRDAANHPFARGKERLGSSGGETRRPLRLTPHELEDLLAFLETLNAF